MRTSELAHQLHSTQSMERLEMSRLEKALIFAAFLPFLMMGVLYLFA